MDPVSHPFPYFGLLVTRDLAVIQTSLEKKASIESQFVNSDPQRAKLCTKMVELLSTRTPDDVKNKRVPPDPKKVEAIVEKCLKKVEGVFARRTGLHKTIHPSEIDAIIEDAKETWHVDPALTRTHVQFLMARDGVTLRVEVSLPTVTLLPVQNLRAESQNGRIVLRWQRPATGCDRVLIARNDRGSPTPQEQAAIEMNTEWTDITAEPGKLYYYRVYSLFGNEAPTVFSAVEAMAHGVVEDLTAKAHGNSVKLTWKLPRGVKRVFVYRAKSPLVNLVDPDGNLIPPPGVMQFDLLVEEVFHDISVNPGESWYYSVVARHTLRCHSVSDSRLVTMPIPPPPASPVEQLTAEGHAGAITLRWQLPAQRCDRILVARNETGSPKPTDIVSSEFLGSEWTDRNVQAGKYYYYAVYSIFSNAPPAVCTTTGAMAPGSVEDLTARVRGNSVTLTWKLPAAVKRVFVYRSATPLVNVIDRHGHLVVPHSATLVAELGAVTSYSESGLQTGDAWYYTVVARHDLRCHSVSESKSVVMRAPPPAPAPGRPQLMPGRVRLTWAPPAGVPKPEYRVERAEAPDPRAPEANTILLKPQGISVLDETPVPGMAYWYFVYTLADGAESLPAQVGPIVALGEVKNLKPTVAPWQVGLTWETPPLALRVQAYRSEGEPPPAPVPGAPLDPNVLLLAPGDRDQLIDTSLVNGKTYGYRVCCVFAGPNHEEYVSPGLTLQARPNPPVPFALDIEANGPKAVLQWTAPPNVDRFVVLRGNQAIGTLVAPDGAYALPDHVKELDELPAATTTFSDEDIAPGQSYWYVVLARHNSGQYSASECKRIAFGMPPETPGDFKARIVPGHIYLSWSAAGQANVTYRLLRSKRADAADPKADLQRWTLSRETLDDTKVEPGTSYWYFLYAFADGLRSKKPASLGPVLATAEVADLHSHPADGQVKLTWTAPLGIKRVEIRRAVGDVPAPPGSPAGAGPKATLMIPTAPGILMDTGLTNNTAYGYRVCCVFANHDGTEIITRGEAILASPCGLPAMVTKIKGEFTSSRAFRLTWQNPAQEGVAVYAVPDMPKLDVGETMAVSDLDGVGTRVDQVTISEAVDPQPSGKKLNYLVFTQNRMIAVLSAKVAILELIEVSAAGDGKRVHFDWEWPDGCSAIQISQHRNNKRVVLATIERDEDGKNSCSVEADADGNEQKFRIRCLSVDPGRYVPGPGRVLTVEKGERTLIRWQFDRTGWIGFRKTVARIRSSDDLTDLERIVIVGKPGAYPRSASDGDIICDWPGDDTVPDGPLHEINLPVTLSDGDGEPLMCKLFVEPKGAAQIIPPDDDKAVLK